MNCLTDYVGLLSCGSAEPISGVYINDYPGMGMELLESISTPEQYSYAGFWESTQRASYQRFRMDIQKVLFSVAEARLDQVLFRTSKQFVQQWQQITPLAPSEEFRGVFVSIEGSKYLGLRIRQLYIYNAGSVSVNEVPFSIFQTQDGKVIYSNNVDLSPGMNYIPVNETFVSDFDKINIMVAVDCTNLDTLTGSFMDFGWEQFDVECGNRFSWIMNNGWSIFPVTAPLNYGLGVDWNQDSTQSGVYIDADLVCSLDQFICHEKEYLIDAWANLLCYQILWSKISSPRANYFAQSNRELTERNMTTFLDNYNQSIATWANQLNLKGEDLCFNCENSGLIQQGFSRP
jgi:hypothetical protein